MKDSVRILFANTMLKFWWCDGIVNELEFVLMWCNFSFFVVGLLMDFQWFSCWRTSSFNCWVCLPVIAGIAIISIRTTSYATSTTIRLTHGCVAAVFVIVTLNWCWTINFAHETVLRCWRWGGWALAVHWQSGDGELCHESNNNGLKWGRKSIRCRTNQINLFTRLCVLSWATPSAYSLCFASSSKVPRINSPNDFKLTRHARPVNLNSIHYTHSSHRRRSCELRDDFNMVKNWELRQSTWIILWQKIRIFISPQSTFHNFP